MNDYQKDFLKEKLYDMELGEKLEIAREFAINANYDVPMEMYEIDCQCAGMRPLEIIEKYGSVDTSCDYFMHDGHEYVGMDDNKLKEWCDETLDDFIRYKDPDDFKCWDEEEFGEWLLKNHSDEMNEAVPLDDDFPYSSDYNTHAEQFAIRWGIKLEILGSEYKRHFADDKDKRYVFKCKITRNTGEDEYGESIVEEYEFEFRQSIAEGSTEPDMYDILACLTKYDPCTYKDFCAEYGYAGGEDSLAVYNGVKEEWSAVLRLFGPENGKCMEELREIC